MTRSRSWEIKGKTGVLDNVIVEVVCIVHLNWQCFKCTVLSLFVLLIVMPYPTFFPFLEIMFCLFTVFILWARFYYVCLVGWLIVLARVRLCSSYYLPLSPNRVKLKAWGYLIVQAFEVSTDFPSWEAASVYLSSERTLTNLNHAAFWNIFRPLG